MKTEKLPPSMYFKHGAYYLVKRREGKLKWTRLARTLPAALRAYAEAIEGRGRGLGDLLDATLEDSRRDCAENTIKAYTRAAAAIAKAFAEFNPDQVRPTDVAQFLDAHKETPNFANIARSFLKKAFDRAVRFGLAEINPVASIPPFKTKTRDRYITPDEFARIKAHASPEIAVIMDLCYLTGQRIGDVLKIKRTDLDDVGVYVRQQKTKTPLVIRWSPELRDAVEQAKNLSGNVKGFLLLASGKGQAFARSTVNYQWTKARKAAGVEDARIHDIRAKSATDAKAAGQDSKSLLGHKSDSSHARYMRAKEVPVVEPVKAKKSAAC